MLFFFKQKAAYKMRSSGWSSDVCSTALMALTALSLLTARKVETEQPKSKVYQLRDGGSLFLRVQPNGSKLWWCRYRLGGAGQVYSIGVYPKVTLEAARAERDRAKALVKIGRASGRERVCQYV